MSDASQPQTKIGVGVLMFSDNRILLGRRKGSHGAGEWAAPGGHLEFGESPEACAKREAQEETGLVLNTLQQGPFTHDYFAEVNRHYITLFMLAPEVTGTPECCEPDKCEGWQWFPLDALPAPLFAPLQTLLKEHDLAALAIKPA